MCACAAACSRSRAPLGMDGAAMRNSASCKEAICSMLFSSCRRAGSHVESPRFDKRRGRAVSAAVCGVKTMSAHAQRAGRRAGGQRRTHARRPGRPACEMGRLGCSEICGLDVGMLRANARTCHERRSGSKRRRRPAHAGALPAALFGASTDRLPHVWPSPSPLSAAIRSPWSFVRNSWPIAWQRRLSGMELRSCR